MNLVPNGSFESYTACPSGPSEIPKCNGWTHNGSSDYYNACDPTTNQTSVPYNMGGYQPAASGNAYAGIVCYYSLAINGHELIAQGLSTALSVGSKYFISFKACLSVGAYAQGNYAVNKIGAMFATKQFTGFNAITTNSPPVYSNNLITDTVNWTRITGSFISDSVYNYIYIGNFFDDTNITKTQIKPAPVNIAYYFIDDVCVSTDSLFANNYSYTGINDMNNFNNFSVYPNPVRDAVTVNSAGGEFGIIITTCEGRLLYSEKNIFEEKHLINISSFPVGVLFLQIKTKQHILNFKLLKL